MIQFIVLIVDVWDLANYRRGETVSLAYRRVRISFRIKCIYVFYMLSFGFIKVEIWKLSSHINFLREMMVQTFLLTSSGAARTYLANKADVPQWKDHSLR